MVAFLTPIRLAMTSTTGVMQFVVQLAQEMIRAGFARERFTPWITVGMSSFFAGADRMTKRAPASM